MHELTLAEAIVDLVREQAHKDAFSRVHRVRLAIGALSHVDPSALEFGFEVVSRGTLAAGARLEIERPPGTGYCNECEEEIAVTAVGEPCPSCGGYTWTVVAGDGMRVVDLEVE